MKRRFQHGMIEIALLGLLMFFVCAWITVHFQQSLHRARDYRSQANAIAVVQAALQAYAQTNKVAFQSGKTIMYIDDQYAPTITYLQNLGFLSTAAGTNVTDPFGSSYGMKLKLESDQSISGMVYLTDSVRDRNGQPDQQRACSIAEALGDAGVCTAPADSTVLQNGRTPSPIANPSGKPAVVGALIHVTP